MTPLAELAHTTNTEHKNYTTAAQKSLKHAIRAGEALLAAKKQVPGGRWMAWIEENCDPSYAACQQYMRLAAYKEHLPSEGLPILAALRTLNGLPMLEGGYAPYPQEVREEAARLKEQGLEYDQVAKALGISTSTVREWIGNRKRYQTGRIVRQRVASREAEELRRGNLAQMAENEGGAVKKSHWLLYALLEALDEATHQLPDKARPALTNAMAAIYDIEDELAKAVGLPPVRTPNSWNPAKRQVV